MAVLALLANLSTLAISSLLLVSRSQPYRLFFFCSFECVWLQLLWLIACAILGFFMYLACVVVAKGKIFDYTLLGALKLLFTFYAFKSFNVLRWCYTLAFIVFYIMSLLPTIYIS